MFRCCNARARFAMWELRHNAERDTLTLFKNFCERLCLHRVTGYHLLKMGPPGSVQDASISLFWPSQLACEELFLECDVTFH